MTSVSLLKNDIPEIRDRKVDLITDCGKVALKAGAIFFKYTPASFIMGIGFATERVYRALRTVEGEARGPDYTQVTGAMYELISGLISLIPFVGPWASMAIDVYLTMYDFSLNRVAGIKQFAVMLGLDPDKKQYTKLEVDTAFTAKKFEAKTVAEKSGAQLETVEAMLTFVRNRIYQEQGWQVVDENASSVAQVGRGFLGYGLRKIGWY